MWRLVALALLTSLSVVAVAQLTDAKAIKLSDNDVDMLASVSPSLKPTAFTAEKLLNDKSVAGNVRKTIEKQVWYVSDLAERAKSGDATAKGRLETVTQATLESLKIIKARIASGKDGTISIIVDTVDDKGKAVNQLDVFYLDAGTWEYLKGDEEKIQNAAETFSKASSPTKKDFVTCGLYRFWTLRDKKRISDYQLRSVDEQKGRDDCQIEIITKG